MEVEHEQLSQGLAVVVALLGVLGGLYVVATFPGDQAGQVQMAVTGIALVLILQGIASASKLLEVE